ncbi:MAG TPA: NifU N-terminal domain-containing protein [Longimicrobiaceae bacterium]|nr:NifU N-terminal domain-containing protein [Longimicrobiaceae bacterium]
MAGAKVRFDPTPNPQAGKFTVGRTLVEGRRGRTYESAVAAATDPIAARLFALEGVHGVFMVADFVTVTKAPEASWAELAPRVQAALRDALRPGA